MKRRRRSELLGAPLLLGLALLQVSAIPQNSGLRFEPELNGYTGLTFTFDPRLESRLDELQFAHWQSILQQSSALLYEALNGRAHLAEVRVLIPYKWRKLDWPLLHKPGAPILVNRRLRYADSDILVGFEDPVYKETPFAIQHDECASQGLNIRMPVSFLEDRNELDPKLKARQLVREFASHRYGVFKESGFRHDFMYPPFSSLAGVRAPASSVARQQPLGQSRQNLVQTLSTLVEANAPSTTNNNNDNHNETTIRGFNERWQDCPFETVPASGLPTGRSIACAPYLSAGQATSGAGQRPAAPRSFNLMSSDPFAYKLPASGAGSGPLPYEYRELADGLAWHFCGENFGPASSAPADEPVKAQAAGWFAHNQLATNKQNIMCHERSTLDVIKSSDDFRRTQYSPSNFNRLPATNFKFLQEMPARLILCVEFTSHLYQARRLDHGILEAAIAKYLAFDLVAESEVALVLFGQQQSSPHPFKRLDSSLDARLTLFNPSIDPFDEPASLYSEQELAQLKIQTGSPASPSAGAKLVKGTCSFARVLGEALNLQNSRSQYDDLGADIVIITSGLFVEDELTIRELLKSSFNQELSRLNLIIYPSTLLSDVKSRDGFVMLNSDEAESIIQNRMAKLQLIQKLTGAQVHLVKEHLDANGDVKMSTLVQFHQIFEQISKGHSWDQTNSMFLIDQRSVDSKLVPTGSRQLEFKFQVDASVQNELLVGFIDPKQHQQAKSGKRFALRNLQLKSPGGQLILTDTHPWTAGQIVGANHEGGADDPWSGEPPANSITGQQQAANGEQAAASPGGAEQQRGVSESFSTTNSLRSGATLDSALFPYRTQMAIAGFHLKAAHLAQLNSSRKLAGVWTLSALTDEPIQTDAIAMGRVNPTGDTITANCWVQSYFEKEQHQSSSNDIVPDQVQAGSPALKAVKVFVETKAGAQAGFVHQVNARLEVQDELGFIKQNVNMLDDGLGSPDMTRGDGIHSQYVWMQNTDRRGYYRVSVELTGSQPALQSPRRAGQQQQQQQQPSQQPDQLGGQDNACCGSFIPAPAANRAQPPSTRHLNRRLYCGSFFVDTNNRLGQQRPPRVHNLTVANVDQESRRVVIRWFEPSVDISAHLMANNNKQPPQPLDTLVGAASPAEQLPQAMASKQSRSPAAPGSTELEMEDQTADFARVRGLVVDQSATSTSSRYDIKLFTDRDMAKRAFDAKQGVGFRFNEWNIDGVFPNASNYGGMKEVTLKIPNGHEGIYFIAMKVYNNLGIGSHMSNIVQFWIRNNLTVDESRAIGVDAEGNFYDENGELLQRGGILSPSGPHLSYSLLRGSPLDGISVLMLISILAFFFAVVCLSLVACLASSTCSSLASAAHAKKHPKSDEDKGRAILSNSSSGTSQKGGQLSSAINSGCSSSMVSSSGCASSQHSEIASSMGAGSETGAHDVEISNKLALVADELHYNQLQAQQQHQQHQAQLIQQAHQMNSSYQQQLDSGAPYAHQLGDIQKANSQQQWLQHTLVNGYAYATVNSQHQPTRMLSQPATNEQAFMGSDPMGDLNQNGLSAATMSPVQSWPADILLNHYDKVKQARERNEAPPVMRIETLEQQGSHHFSEGLPAVDEHQAADQSYLIRQQHSQAPSYFNKQLQQQLNSVLKNKQRNKLPSSSGLVAEQPPSEIDKSSPALEGLTENHEICQENPYGHIGLAPPPPQYVYCTQNSQDQMLVEPSLYSQVTGLQQVNNSESANDFYANQGAQWPLSASSIYSTVGHEQQHQYQPTAHSRSSMGDASLAFDNLEKSTISEV